MTKVDVLNNAVRIPDDRWQARPEFSESEGANWGLLSDTRALQRVLQLCTLF